jgi:hypothetical protein
MKVLRYPACETRLHQKIICMPVSGEQPITCALAGLLMKILQMHSWKTTQYEHFVGKKILFCKRYQVDKFFVTYMRYNVWFEMKFEHNLN